MATLIIIYDSLKGEYCPDGQAKLHAKTIVDVFNNSGKDKTVRIATELIIYAIRVLIKNGKLNHENVIFKFQDQNIVSDKNGMLGAWPEGFCDNLERLNLEILAN